MSPLPKKPFLRGEEAQQKTDERNKQLFWRSRLLIRYSSFQLEQKDVSSHLQVLAVNFRVFKIFE